MTTIYKGMGRPDLILPLLKSYLLGRDKAVVCSQYIHSSGKLFSKGDVVDLLSDTTNHDAYVVLFNGMVYGGCQKDMFAQIPRAILQDIYGECISHSKFNNYLQQSNSDIKETGVGDSSESRPDLMLPADVLLSILICLGAADLLSCRQVCAQWCEVVEHPTLWRNQWFLQWPQQGPPVEVDDLKGAFFAHFKSELGKLISRTYTRFTKPTYYAINTLQIRSTIVSVTPIVRIFAKVCFMSKRFEWTVVHLAVKKKVSVDFKNILDIKVKSLGMVASMISVILKRPRFFIERGAAYPDDWTECEDWTLDNVNNGSNNTNIITSNLVNNYNDINNNNNNNNNIDIDNITTELEENLCVNNDVREASDFDKIIKSENSNNCEFGGEGVRDEVITISSVMHESRANKLMKTMSCCASL